MRSSIPVYFCLALATSHALAAPILVSRQDSNTTTPPDDLADASDPSQVTQSSSQQYWPPYGDSDDADDADDDNDDDDDSQGSDPGDPGLNRRSNSGGSLTVTPRFLNDWAIGGDVGRPATPPENTNINTNKVYIPPSGGLGAPPPDPYSGGLGAPPPDPSSGGLGAPPSDPSSGAVSARELLTQVIARMEVDKREVSSMADATPHSGTQPPHKIRGHHSNHHHGTHHRHKHTRDVHNDYAPYVAALKARASDILGRDVT
jgi:hypothetical protein